MRADRHGRARARDDDRAHRGRTTFGRPIVDHGVVQHWIAEARIRIEQARLLVLKTAWLMDTVGNKGARIEISAIKVASPEVATWVLDRAIQAHGAGGVSQDHLLAELYSVARILQIADGPDEVHRMAIARRETKRTRAARGLTALRRARPRRLLRHPAVGRGGSRRQPGHRQAARDVELGDVFQREVSARPVPVEDAVVEPEDRAGQQPRVGLGDRALLHAARQEGRPRELEVARAGPRAAGAPPPRAPTSGGRRPAPARRRAGGCAGPRAR